MIYGILFIQPLNLIIFGNSINTVINQGPIDLLQQCSLPKLAETEAEFLADLLSRSHLNFKVSL